MPGNRKNLLQKLTEARQALNHAQARVAQLEADLVEADQPAAVAMVTEQPVAYGQARPRQCVGDPDCLCGFSPQEAAIQQRYIQRLEILHEIDRGLIQGRSVETLIEATLHHLRQLIPCQRASILLIDPTQAGWAIFAIDHTQPTALGKGIRVPIPANGFADFTAEKVQLIPDLRTWPDADFPDAQLVQEGLLSALRVLLTVQGNPIGMLSLSADRVNFFTAEHQEIAKQVTSPLAIAINQLLLSETVARRNLELEEHLTAIKQQEIARQHSEELYRHVVEYQVDVICRFDPDFNLTFVNESYSALFGKTPAAMIGRSILEEIPPAYHAQVIGNIATLDATKRFISDENPILLADGGERWFSWTNRNIIDAAGHTIEYQGVGHDITDQKNLLIAQQNHAQAAEETRQFLQSALDAYAASVAVLAPDGTILNINATWQHLCLANGASSPTCYLGENYLAVCDRSANLLSADALDAADGIRAVIEGGQNAFYMEYAFHSPTVQSWFAMSVTPFAEAVPRRVVVAHSSITARKQAEAAERAQRHFAEALLASLAALTNSLEVENVLQQILNSVAAVVPSEAGSIILFEGNDGRVAYLRGFAPAATLFFSNYRFPLDSYGADHALTNKQPYFIPDTQTAANWIALPVTEWIRSSLGIPIEIRGHVIGMLVIDSAIPHHFQPADIEKLQAFALYASLALENAYSATQLEQRVIARTAELQTAKEQVEAILDNSLDGILLVHPDLRVEQANTAFTKLFACARSDCLGQPFLGFVHEGDVDHLSTMLHAALSSETGKQLEMRARRQDGSLFDAELSIGQIQGDGLVCTIRDVTARKQSERQLRYYASLQENVSDAVISTDLDLHIQSWNQAAEAIYGWDVAEAIDQNISTFLRSQYASPESYQRSWQRLFEQGRWHGEIQHYRKDGTAIHVLSSITVLHDEHGNAIGLVVINHDITERKQAEEAIRNSEARYRLLADHITDWVTRINVRGEYLYVSPSVRTLLGYEPAELVGRPGYSFMHPEDRALVQLPSTLLDENTPSLFTYRMQHKAGHYVWLETQSRLIHAADTGEVIEIVSSSRDITERKRAEAELRAKTAEEHEFQIYLKALHEITLELTAIDELDTFYKRAIELGLARFGFERLGLLLYDAERALVLGTYGTDTDGKVVPEQHIRLDATRLTGILKRTLTSTERFFFEDHIPLFSNSESVNLGWNAVAVLWNGKQSLGWLSADNGIYYKPVAKPLLDILALYSLTLGTLLGRKQLEADLRASEEKFRRLLEAAPVAVIISDQTGQITLVNDRAELLFDYSRAELVAQPVEILVPDALPYTPVAKRTGHFATARLLQPRNELDLFARRKDGSQFPVEIELSQIQTADGLMVMRFIVDITERKRAADALREQRDFLQLVIDSVPDLILVKDRSGRFQLVNDLTAQIYGMTPAAMIGKTDADVNLNPDEVTFFLQKDRETLARGQPIFIPEESILSRYYQTSKIPLRNPAGVYDRLLIVASDITERRRTEQALEASRHFAQSIAETAPDIIYIYDVQAHSNVYVNRSIAALMGYSPQEIADLGPSLTSTVMDPLNTLAQANHLNHVMAGADDESFAFEYRMRSKQGEWRWFLSRDTIFQRDEHGTVTQLLGVATDITERKEAEEALQQALAAEKDLGELKSRFVSMASHEFRTPLATILALTETLRAYRHKLADAQIDQRLGKIQEQVAHLRDIMEDVLRLAQLQARRAEFNPVRLDLDALCRSVMDEFESQPTVGPRLVYSCDATLHDVKLDRKLMRQIISNLVSNAIKYSPAEKPIVVSLDHQNEMLIFRVRDEGIGIPATDLKHLFEPFHRAHNVGTIAGTGLGLTITKESVELHAGTITVDSRVGIGTTFTVCIPIADL